jgi:hypothetical protein
VDSKGIMAGNFPIANVGFLNKSLNAGSGEANARLIAAAPDLLAAAEDIINLLLPIDVGARIYWDNLKKAIAKARED